MDMDAIQVPTWSDLKLQLGDTRMCMLRMEVDAHYSNSVYGNSYYVQPETLRSFYVIKYWQIILSFRNIIYDISLCEWVARAFVLSPNIYGRFFQIASSMSENIGCFLESYYTKKQNTNISGTVHDDVCLVFNAKTSNNIYGHSNIVQPESYRVHYIIKYWFTIVP